uniref:Uncharacterized protein n=1 Tax=Cyclopterus lumpus TaxID=8103 RepID=A0A8C2WDX6_CYCLU
NHSFKFLKGPRGVPRNPFTISDVTLSGGKTHAHTKRCSDVLKNTEECENKNRAQTFVCI